MLVYEGVTEDSAQVIASSRVGKRRVLIRSIGDTVHLIERDGPSVRVTTLTECKDSRVKDGRRHLRALCGKARLAFRCRRDARSRSLAGSRAGRCVGWRVRAVDDGLSAKPLVS
jgi:hypothetical protein